MICKRTSGSYQEYLEDTPDTECIANGSLNHHRIHRF